MDILFLLVPIALVFLVIAVALFFWAIRNGQYDDMESQSMKIIMDEHRSDQKSAKKSNTTEQQIATDDGDKSLESISKESQHKTKQADQ